MIDFLSTYAVYIKTFFKARAEYKTSFVLGMVSNFYCYFITYMSYWVLMNGVDTVGGWDFSDLSILYGLSLITYSISGTLIWYSAYFLEDLIISGQLDIMLLRPQGLIRQMIFQRFGDTFLGQIVVTVIFLCAAFTTRAEALNLQMGFYLILAIIGGIFMQTGSMILFGAFSFWTMKSGALIDLLFYDLRNMTHYPLALYPKGLRIFLTFVLPWAFINYYPTLLITEKNMAVYETVLGMIAPFVGVLWFILAMAVFRQGLKRYTGGGG
ncbi:MAG: ABC transporter permease [Lachnospiraceae bacterium]|nr:ABC transporter permease [Lachnospiraceae bacterium]